MECLWSLLAQELFTVIHSVPNPNGNHLSHFIIFYGPWKRKWFKSNVLFSISTSFQDFSLTFILNPLNYMRDTWEISTSPHFGVCTWFPLKSWRKKTCVTEQILKWLLLEDQMDVKMDWSVTRGQKSVSWPQGLNSFIWCLKSQLASFKKNFMFVIGQDKIDLRSLFASTSLHLFGRSRSPFCPTQEKKGYILFSPFSSLWNSVKYRNFPDKLCKEFDQINAIYKSWGKFAEESSSSFSLLPCIFLLQSSFCFLSLTIGSLRV